MMLFMDITIKQNKSQQFIEMRKIVKIYLKNQLTINFLLK